VNDLKIEIPIYHDTWLDNGVENLYRLLSELQMDEPDLLEVQLEPDRLLFEIFDFEKFPSYFAYRIRCLKRIRECDKFG